MSKVVSHINFSPYLRDGLDALDRLDFKTAAKKLELAAKQAERQGRDEYHLILGQWGKALMNLNRYDDALAVFVQQAAAAEKLNGKGYDYALAINNIAAVAHWNEEFAKAEPYLVQAVEILRNCDHLDEAAGAPFSLLAEVRASQGRLVEARDLLQSAFEIFTEYAQPGDPELLRTHLELSMLNDLVLGKSDRKKFKMEASNHMDDFLNLYPPLEAQMRMFNLVQQVDHFFSVIPPGAELALKPKAKTKKEKSLSKSAEAEPRQLRLLEPVSQDAAADVSAFQLHISLKGIKPPIWRRLTVPADITLQGLHLALNRAMGWHNSHLHEFEIGRTTYVDPKQHDNPRAKDERKVRLADLKLFEGMTFDYIYDFGDGWEHTVKIEKALHDKSQSSKPVVIGGKRACPPEDCGGPHLYQQLTKILKDPDHPHHKRAMADFEGFDPEAFSLKR